MAIIQLFNRIILPFDMIPYSFGGVSVNEKLPIEIVPLRSIGMLFGPLRSRSLWILLSGRVANTISGCDAFDVVSLTRDTVNHINLKNLYHFK